MWDILGFVALAGLDPTREHFMRHVIRLATIVVVLAAGASLAACGNSSNDASRNETKTSGTAGDSSADTDTSAVGEGDTSTEVNPCDLYSVEAMAAQMGVDDVTAEPSTGVSPTCKYRSEAHYLDAELTVLDEDQMANTPRDPTAYEASQGTGTARLEVSGIGDEVFGTTMKGGVSLVVRTGKTGYSLLLTNAGGGPEAGNWADEAAMVASAKAILTSLT